MSRYLTDEQVEAQTIATRARLDALERRLDLAYERAAEDTLRRSLEHETREQERVAIIGRRHLFQRFVSPRARPAKKEHDERLTETGCAGQRWDRIVVECTIADLASTPFVAWLERTRGRLMDATDSLIIEVVGRRPM